MPGNASYMRFHTSGGRIALTVLRRFAEMGLVHGNGTLGFGSRQELHVCGIPKDRRNLVRHGAGGLLPEHHPRRPNIVSTRAATGRSHRTAWLSEGAYDHVLESFQTPPAIPINLVDPRQSYVPLYTGQLHAVASSEPEFWHIWFNTASQGPPSRLAPAIHSTGVAPVARLIQQALVLAKGPDLAKIHALVEKQLGGLLQEVEYGNYSAPDDSRPLTGFVLDSGSGTYSLGIPVQSRTLPCQFIVDLAVLGRRIDLATAYLTPWKSLVLHGIPRGQRPAFEKLLLRHRISVTGGGWDSVCFNDFYSPKALRAGTELLNALNEQHPHPGSLRLGLVEHQCIIPDTSIIVRAESPRSGGWPLWGNNPRFSVFIREGFDRNQSNLLAIAADLSAKELPEALFSVIHRYSADEATLTPPNAKVIPVVLPGTAYRCAECDAEYSPLYGDPLGKIEAGTPFDELPSTWRCPTCEAPLGAYVAYRGTAA